MSTLPMRWITVRFGRELDAGQVRSFLVSVLADRSFGDVVFEAESVKRLGEFRIGATNVGRVARMLTAHVGGVQVEEAAARAEQHHVRHVVALSTRKRALDSSDEPASSMRLLGALTSQPRSVHQIRIGRRVSPSAVPQRIEAVPGDAWIDAVAGVMLVGKQRVDGEARKAIAAKRGAPGAQAMVSLLSRSGASTTAYESALRSLQSPGLRVRLRREPLLSLAPSPVLNVDELLVLLGWPYGDVSYPGVDRSGATVLPARVRFENDDRLLGHGSRGEQVGVSVGDSLRHLHVIGPTGVGKSNLLLHLIRQDIEAGRGAVVIDPKGDLISDVLTSTSARHHKRLVVIDPSHPTHALGFNPLLGRRSELAVDGVLHVFKDMYASSWGPRTQDVLHSSLLSIVGTEWATLALVPQLLSDSGFRRRVLGSRRLPSHLLSFWSWFEGLSGPERSQVIAPALNKLRPFVMRSTLRSMLGQVSPAFDPIEVFTKRKILLVALRKGEIGSEAAQLIGSLLVSNLWQLAQRRTGISADRRHPVMFYLDEFQDYLRLPTDFADVLAQSRGLGLGLNLAHQHLAQLRPDVRAALLANAQNRVAFRLSHEDASVLSRGADDLDALDFTRLGAFRTYASVLAHGQPSGWMSMSTVRPPRVLYESNEVRDTLLERDGVARAAVDAELERLIGVVDADDGVGRRDRRAS